MGPRRLEGGVVLLRIEVWIITRREGPEEVARDLKEIGSTSLLHAA